MKKRMFSVLIISAILIIACEKNNNKSSIKIHNFSAIPENDTVPCKINVVYAKTYKGLINYLFIHEGAYLDQDFSNQQDSTQMTSMSTEEVSRIDTFKIYYNTPGKHTITLEVNSEVYEDDIVLYSEK